MSFFIQQYGKLANDLNEELARVTIQRKIFQGDILSPLLFIVGLIPLSQILRKVNAAASFVRYSAGILKWTKDKLKAQDRKTRKIMAMNRMYHPQSDTDRLYIPIVEGGRELLSIADCVETEEQNLSLYLDQSEERLLRLSKSERI